MRPNISENRLNIGAHRTKHKSQMTCNKIVAQSQSAEERMHPGAVSSIQQDVVSRLVLHWFGQFFKLCYVIDACLADRGQIAAVTLWEMIELATIRACTTALETYPSVGRPWPSAIALTGGLQMPEEAAQREVVHVLLEPSRIGWGLAQYPHWTHRWGAVVVYEIWK